MERMQLRIRQIAGGDQAKLARLKDGAGHVAMYAKERDGGDEGGDVHVLLGGSHAAVLRLH